METATVKLQLMKYIKI